MLYFLVFQVTGSDYKRFSTKSRLQFEAKNEFLNTQRFYSFLALFSNTARTIRLRSRAEPRCKKRVTADGAIAMAAIIGKVNSTAPGVSAIDV